MNEHSPAQTHDVVHSTWAEIASWLEARKRAVCDEIRDYPTPIAGCDQQFNYLLEQQAQITSALAQARSALSPQAAPSEAADGLDAFLGAATVIDAELRRRLQSRLRPGARDGKQLP